MKYYSFSDIDVNNEPWNFCIPRKTNCCFTATVEKIESSVDGRKIIALKTPAGRSYTMVID